MNFTFHPATPQRWRDIESLFGERGACGGCWCMSWRRRAADFLKHKGLGNKRAFQSLVSRDEQPGILVYDGDRPVGWCAVAPREVYLKLANSRVLAPVDNQPVWSVSCLFVDKAYRRRGISVGLLQAAVRFAGRRGAKVVEGYPVVPYTTDMPAAFAWTGLLAAFERAGFVEVARRSNSRPIMRRVCSPPATA